MSYKSLFQDVRGAVDYVHMEGDLKERTCQDLAKYLKKDDRLPKVLYNLKKSGAKTFLLTNSDWHYSNKVMEFLLDFPDVPYAGTNRHICHQDFTGFSFKSTSLENLFFS